MDISQRYHSHFESLCNMTDILRLASSEVVSGHMNDAMEIEVLKRMKGLRGEALLQIGTSVDHRLLRIGCSLFGVKRNSHQEGDLVILECQIPLINFTIIYVFNDALTKANMPIEKQVRHLEEINSAVAKLGIKAPRYILLAGIEWDLKWYKDNEKPIDWSEIHSITMENVSLFQKQFPMAKAPARNHSQCPGRELLLHPRKVTKSTIIYSMSLPENSIQIRISVEVCM